MDYRLTILIKSNGFMLKRLNDGCVSHKHAAFDYTRH